MCGRTPHKNPLPQLTSADSITLATSSFNIFLVAALKIKRAEFYNKITKGIINRKQTNGINGTIRNLKNCICRPKTVRPTRDMEAGIFLPLPHLSLPLIKHEKATVDNFLNFCGSVACLFLHFIFEEPKTYPYFALILSTLHKLIDCFELPCVCFSDILQLVLNVEQCSLIFLSLRNP